jgi:hypothetical protein
VLPASFAAHLEFLPVRAPRSSLPPIIACPFLDGFAPVEISQKNFFWVSASVQTLRPACMRASLGQAVSAAGLP